MGGLIKHSATINKLLARYGVKSSTVCSLATIWERRPSESMRGCLSGSMTTDMASTLPVFT